MPADPIAEMASDFAAAAVDLARDFGARLDYSEASLQQVENILGRLHDDMHGGTAALRSLDAPRPQPSTADMVEISKLWGSYFGEVVRRRWGGEWSIETYPSGGFATLTLTVAGHKLFPSMKVYRRLTAGAHDNLLDFYERVRTKLETLPGNVVQ